MIEAFRLIVEWVVLGIEALAVVVIVVGIIFLAVRKGTIRYLFQLQTSGAHHSYRHQLRTALLLGLELLVAADVIRTVALEPTVTNIVVLALLVLVRTFLSWSMSMEIEGCWPWQRRVRQQPELPASEEITLAANGGSRDDGDRDRRSPERTS